MTLLKHSIGAAVALALTVTAQAETLTVTEVWKTPAVFEHPESVAYDAASNALYLSNIKGDFGAADGDGYIAKLGTDGELIKADWVSGLDAPKGIAIKSGLLYVADLTQLVVVDLKKAEVVQRYKAADNSFLNDVAITDEGEIYITDTATNRIYVLKDDGLHVWLESPELESPNGLFADGDNLIVASWGVPTEGWSTKVPGHLLRVSLRDRQITDVGSDKPIGNLDGLHRLDESRYLATDWMAGVMMTIDQSGEVVKLVELSQGTADLTYLPEQGRVILPVMIEGTLRAFDIK